MPHRLAKGPIGLRLDYLSQFQSVRDDVRTRLTEWLSTNNPNDLAHDGHPVKVLTGIRAHGHTIDVVNDKKKEFVGKLNYLDERESMTHAQEAVTPGNVGRRYIADDLTNPPLNQDATGNRAAFYHFWAEQLQEDPLLFKKIAEGIVQALDANVKIEFWWDCSLGEEGGAIQVVNFGTIVRVFFRTKHKGLVTPEPEPGEPPHQKRDADPEPPDPDYVLQP